jgi:hypothetical protein
MIGVNVSLLRRAYFRKCLRTVLTGIFGPKREDVTGGQRKSRNGERVVPLICNSREMDCYTRPVSGQLLGKHFTAVTKTG